MNNQLENLMYEAGLTAQGCWNEMDDYDKEAIKRFAESIVRECALLCSDPVVVLQHWGLDSDAK